METPKDGAPSKASPSFSGWQQSIWFVTISDSRPPAEKFCSVSIAGLAVQRVEGDALR
jgi:hypothetical protein